MTRRSRNTLVSTGSSSTTRIRSGMRLLRQGQGDGHRGADASPAIRAHPPAVVRDDPIRNSQAQSRPAGTRLPAAKISRRQVGNVLLFDPDALVDDIDEQHFFLAVARHSYREIADV